MKPKKKKKATNQKILEELKEIKQTLKEVQTELGWVPNIRDAREGKFSISGSSDPSNSVIVDQPNPNVEAPPNIHLTEGLNRSI